MIRMNTIFNQRVLIKVKSLPKLNEELQKTIYKLMMSIYLQYLYSVCLLP